MNPPLPPPAPASSTRRLPPTNGTFSELLDTYCRARGIARLSLEEAAKLPPWTKEEADAFKLVINEAFEWMNEDEHGLNENSPALNQVPPLPGLPVCKLPPVGETVSEALNAYRRKRGIPLPNAQELAGPPPWSSEEADAFARIIEEARRQVDQAEHAL